MSRNPRYEFIFGRDFLQHTGMTLDYHEQVFQWEEMRVPMPFVHRMVREVKTQNNLDPNRYQFVPHGEIEAVLPTYLERGQKSRLLQTVAEYSEVFLPDVGLVPGPPYDITLSDEKPVYLRPYPTPHSLLQQAKDIVDKHVQAGTLTNLLHAEVKWRLADGNRFLSIEPTNYSTPTSTT
jgi:hypothetical protein